MKILLVLLGCLAVVNAGYGGYSLGHHYGGGYHFTSSCFYPPTRCYSYSTYFKSCNAWYTTKYYSGILKEYPDSTCEVKAVAALISECDGKLKDKREEIKKEMDDRLVTFKTDLGKLHDKFKADHKTYQTSRYQPCIDQAEKDGDTDEKTRLEGERDKKISDYDLKLDERKAEAEKAYQGCIDETIKKLEEYHGKLISNFETCLNNRAKKIGEYEKLIDDRVDDYVKKYEDCLNDRVTKTKEAFKSILLKICADAAETEVTDVVELYAPCTPVTDLVADYRKKLEENATKLKDYYRCAYRCYAYSGCVSFYKRGYYSYCTRLGHWWTYKITWTTPCTRYVKYTYRWCKPTYKGLKSCDPIAEHQTKDELLIDMRAKNTKAVTDARACVTTFIADWEKKHAEYSTKYREIITCRHEAILAQYTECLRRARCDRVLTDEDNTKIAEKKKELEDKVDPLVEEYEKKLKEKRDAAEKTATESIDAWEKCLEDYVVKVGDRYQECLDEIVKKQEAYGKKLDTMIAARRKCLEDNYNKVIDKNVKCTENIIAAYVKDTTDAKVKTFVDNYRNKLEEERDVVLKDFDDTWAKLKVELVAHYSCSLKCGTINYCVRSWVRPSCFSWTVCYPVTRCYSYKYTWYRRSYYGKYYGGHYLC